MIQQGRINFRMDIEDVLLNIDTAITLGLSINEMVSNSLKHAFPDRMKGEIFISLNETSKDNFCLTIKDDGVGLPPNLDFRNTSSLGLQLVNTLIEQLEGTIDLDNGSGTKFSITFSAPSEKENISFTN
jgi:two-component sensor histidine kinase